MKGPPFTSAEITYLIAVVAAVVGGLGVLYLTLVVFP